ASTVIVYSHKQEEHYIRRFSVPKEQLVCVPYYTTCWDTSYHVTEGEYIFSGGDYTRDYASLITAVRDRPYRTVIAARFRHYFDAINVPPNVEIVTVGHSEFFRLMSGARVVVVPLKGGLLQSGGQQTYLNAMAMGKPVIVADDCGASEYIRDGHTGIVIPPEDPMAMRAALERVWNDTALASRLGANAQRAAQSFSPDRFFTTILKIVENAVRANRCRC
ncbi:MAG: glycosyltransferase, partial [Candidatus Micrarchaeaceae archaeon]